MKIVSLNIEGSKHVNRVIPFLEAEQADVICLQEAQLDLHPYLEKAGYTFHVLPMTLRTDDSHLNEPEGLLLATRHETTFDSFYYHMPEEGIQPFIKAAWRDTCAYGVLFADVTFQGKLFRIGTTHFTWTPDGMPNSEQDADADALFSFLRTQKPHVICGDFNIPRLHNYNYKRLTELYTDAIPTNYTSSLDRTLHRCGKDAQRSIMFDEYMVDYLCTQTPYTASDVRLQFGISDHAGIVATLHSDLTRP